MELQIIKYYTQSILRPVYSYMTMFVHNFHFKVLNISMIIILHEKFLQLDWLRGVVFQLNLKYLHVKITCKPFAGSSINN